MDVARRLLQRARERNERRLLVLSGEATATRERAGELLAALDLPAEEVTCVGPDPADRTRCESLGYDQTASLLGTTRSLVVLDCHGRCEPNDLARLVGAVDGGGLFVLLTPPLERWEQRRDAFDQQLAVAPFETSEVTGLFRRRLVETLRQHSGVALVDVDAGTVERDAVDGPPPHEPPPPVVPERHRFPREAYERCLTGDQVDALAAFETLCDPPSAVVVEANRGRGKSAVAGFAGASLALGGADVLVTAPQYRNARTLMRHAGSLLDGTSVTAKPRLLETDDGRLEYRRPTEALEQLDEYDVVVVDEAAALPVPFLAATLACDRVAYVTTTHGYEGAGRGFTVRFDSRLEASRHERTDRQLTTPVRYAPGDPVEVWSFRALALDARPPVASVVSGATPSSVCYRELTGEQLLEDEALLREVFGLLVLAHYRTEPNDLARLLDAPNVSVHALFEGRHPVTVALLAREGSLDAGMRASVYEGSRIRGNLVPDVLMSQLRDEQAGALVGDRVMRIATHDAVRSRGLGSHLLGELSRDDADWVGVGYGATPRLVRFWRRNGFLPVHLSTTRNRRSGEHSAVMLQPRSDAGEALCERHRKWFRRRLPGMLADSLRDVDPDVICELSAAVPAASLNLTPWEWRHAAAVAAGPGIFEMSPRPIRQLAMRALTGGPSRSGRPPVALSVDEKRLLVARTLQLRPREAVADELGYHSEAAAMRALGAAVRKLVEAYGPRSTRAELDRFE